MNNKRRKTRELNNLSAYLDNALPAREMRKLEARLAVEPELREKLADLRRTKLALSRLTRLRAPRNFTLTPDMVPERRPHRQPLQGALRLASALAAILLVVMFGAEFILGEVRQPAMLADEAPAMEAARAPEAEEPEPLIQWGQPGTGGESVGMGGESAEIEEPMGQMEVMPEEETTEEQAEAPSAKSDELILGINADEGGEIIERSEPAAIQQEPEPLPWAMFFHWAQIALVVVAVGGALALLILRLRRRA